MSTDKDPTAEAPANTMSKEEIEQLVKTLSAMKVKPKADTPEDLIQWMSSLVGAEVPVAESSAVKTEHSVHTHKEIGEYHLPYKQPIRISTFSGHGKGETSYELWRYEVTCLMKEGHSKEAIMMAIRRSLKGEPANALMRLGSVEIVEEILLKFDSIYGSVLETEDILAEFYSARQKDNEDCATWSVRLEDLINKAIKKGKVSPVAANEMLRTMFYKGLRQDLRDITGHIFHTTYDFDKLRVAIRKVETEHQPAVRPKHATVKSATTTSDDRFDQLQAQLNQLSAHVMQLRQPYPQNPHYGSQPRQPFQKGKGKKKGYGKQQFNRMPNPELLSTAEMASSPAVQQDEVICFKCHQKGHIAIGCRVRLDHQRADLNSSRPNPGAKGLVMPK